MTAALGRNASVTIAERARADFPILAQESASGQPLIYLDHAATSQKPLAVLDALRDYYSCDNANVHRGAHQLSARATEAFEGARLITAQFVAAASPREIVFTRNASEAINLVARTWGDAELKPGDEVLLKVMEHHSSGALAATGPAHRLCVEARVDRAGHLDLEDLRAKLMPAPACGWASANTLGCCNPVDDVVALAAQHGLSAVDACQSWPANRWMLASSGLISLWVHRTSSVVPPAWGSSGRVRHFWSRCPPSWAVAK